MTPASPFVLYISSTLLFTLIAYLIKCCRTDKGKPELRDMIVIESLEPFFSMLKNKDREFWFAEEKVCRERIGLKRVSEKNYLNLIFAPPNFTSNRLRSVHNYDILSNPRYLDLFHYAPLDGRSENASSDMVARLLYIGEDKVQSQTAQR